MGKESRRPHGMRWNNKNKRWEWIGQQKGATNFYIDANGYLTDLTAIDDTNVTVGSLLTANTARITGIGSITSLNAATGTIANANIGSTAIIQRMAVAGVGSLATVNITTGTITNINVGTLATIRSFIVAGVGSIGNLQAGIIACGATAITKLAKFTGTLGGIAAVGTSLTAVGTVTGITADTNNAVFFTPRAVLGGNIILGHGWVPSTNTLNINVANLNNDSAGSLPHIGLDVWVVAS